MGSDSSAGCKNPPPSISTHAPRVGSDTPCLRMEGITSSFQPTLPVWGATPCEREYDTAQQYFNPRSPCGERPDEDIPVGHKPTDFNPRSPCGERLLSIAILHISKRFQPTLPVWGATRYQRAASQRLLFQPTLPVWGATIRHRLLLRLRSDFNPRSPCGERLMPTSTKWRVTYFNPRSPCGERHGLSRTRSITSDFNPRSPCGERPIGRKWSTPTIKISTHAPRVGSDRR